MVRMLFRQTTSNHPLTEVGWLGRYRMVINNRWPGYCVDRLHITPLPHRSRLAWSVYKGD